MLHRKLVKRRGAQVIGLGYARLRHRGLVEQADTVGFADGFALGFQLSGSGCPLRDEGSFRHSAAGGRVAFAHPETLTAVGYGYETLRMALR